MKTDKYKTGSLLLLAFLLIKPAVMEAQEAKLSRQELKEIRQARLEADFHILDTLISSRNFVLKADYLRTRDGVLVPVPSGLNFIMVNMDEGVLQTGSNSGNGYNGVGGVTAQGKIGKWDLSKDSKKLTFTLRFSMLSTIGNYDVLMFIGADGNAAATITGMSSGWLTWDGQIYSIGSSRVFKGQETY